MSESKKLIDYFRKEWKLAEKLGNHKWAISCKEDYKFYVIEFLKKPHNEYHDELKQFPMIMLN